jgi:hypothetical protein
MLNLTNLSKKEQIYLLTLIKISKITQNPLNLDTLACLKSGVLESALSSIKDKIKPRQYRVLEKIIKKIVYPSFIDGEILVPMENRLC